MKKVVLLCMAALCFCAAGLFSSCGDTADRAFYAGETGEQISEEIPVVRPPQSGETDAEDGKEEETADFPEKEQEGCTHGGHIWGAWQTVFSAGCDKNGLKICHCTECGASKAEIIPALAHTAEKQIYNQSVHWSICGRCGEVFGREEHTFGGEVCGGCGFACDFTQGLEYEKIEGREEYRVTGDGGFAGDELVVPATYKGLPVTEVGDYAFSYTDARKIALPESVQRVGYQAFSRCSAKEIVLPQKMQSLGDAAFYYCMELQKINLPDGIDRVGDSAFSYCISLREITIPDSVIEIGYEAFDHCSLLTRVTLGKNLERIDYAFFRCDRLFEVYNRSVLPVAADGTNKYGGLAKNAKNLYEIGTGYSKINTTENGIRYFTDTDKVYLLDYYGTETEIALPETIGGKPCVPAIYAFNDAENIRKLTVPGSIKNIPYNCFSGMPDLTEVILEEGVESIDSGCFLSAGLTKAELPASLISLAGRSFGGNVTQISVAAGNPVYESVGNCVIETASKTLVWGCAASVIPDDGSVTSIGSYAFSGLSQLKEIVIPASVKEIGGSAFYSSGLEKVVLSEGLETIGMFAFSYCEHLSEINIPSSVKTIYTSAFYAANVERAEFAAADGWKVFQNPDQAPVTEIGEEILSDPAAAAEQLNYWSNIFYIRNQHAAFVRSI